MLFVQIDCINVKLSLRAISVGQILNQQSNVQFANVDFLLTSWVTCWPSHSHFIVGQD